MKAQVKVMQLELPTNNIRGAAVMRSPTDYIMLVDSRLSELEKQKVFVHELRHIVEGDLLRTDMTASQIEMQAHRMDKELIPESPDQFDLPESGSIITVNIKTQPLNFPNQRG